VTEPSSASGARVNWVAIVALLIGVVSIFFNPYVLVSAVAIVLGVVAVVSAQRAGDQRGYRLIAILGIVAGVVGAVLLIVSNTISANI
jgi:hypothetical protein